MWQSPNKIFDFFFTNVLPFFYFTKCIIFITKEKNLHGGIYDVSILTIEDAKKKKG